MTGELVEEIPPHHEIAEIAEVPKLKTKLGCATSRAGGAHTQPWQPEKDFNFPRATLASYSSATRLQRMLHSIKHTPLMAAQANGRINF